MRVCVVGLGYIGLPTAAALAAAGHAVTGTDINPTVLAELRQGRTRIAEPGLDALVARTVRDGALAVAERPVAADAFIIAVPTPLRGLAHKRADLSHVADAASSVASVLTAGNLVVLESTSPPGTAVDLVAPLLRERTGLIAGRDYHLAHCPERVLPGRILDELANNDRIIGGIDAASADAAEGLYRSFVRGRIFRTDATTAELVKLMENTYRDVNVALANELAVVAERLGVDVWEAIDLANRHPRVRLLRPGPGVGGHCIAVDPWFVVGAAPELTRLIAAGRAVNDAMPLRVADRVADALGTLRGARVVALGITYKADVDDIRESPAGAVVGHLRVGGADVLVHDAMVAADASVEELARGADALLLLVDHASYARLDPLKIGPRMRRRIVVDARSFLPPLAWREAGFEVIRLGDGRAPGFVSSPRASARQRGAI